MDALHLFRRLYSLDTLDTRLTTSSPSSSAVTPSSSSEKAGTANDSPQVQRTLPPGASPPRWRTAEFYLYYAILAFVMPQMFISVMRVSLTSHPNYERYADLLSPGWIPGRKVDNSDSQYSTFRDNIPYMAAVVLVHPLLRRVYNAIFPAPRGGPVSAEMVPTTTKETTVSPDHRSTQRISFDLYFALVFVAVLHGFSAFKILLILYVNYTLATKLPKDYIPAFAWIFNVGILFINEFCHGYHYVSIAKSALPMSASASEWGSVLDDFGGLIPRWEILFNFTILRLISFDMDYYWSLGRSRSSSPIEKKQIDSTNLSDRDRVTLPAPQDAYLHFSTYLAYALYSPLYLAGPILTFNDYISQTRFPSLTFSYKRTIMYGIRFLLLILCMEILLHFIYTVAICSANPDWDTYTPFQLTMLGYFNLHIVWLKLLIPFRFFRLWALVDHMDPPENVVRCMSDNYSVLAFWRGWHRSFNRWIVRYVYIPLGGGAGRGIGKFRGLLNTLVVFTFVALWHDINLQLLTWGWLITLFVLPEVLATMAFPAAKWQHRPEMYRVICGVGGVGNVVMLGLANLVGFAIGLEGLKGMVKGIVGSLAGLGFLPAAFVFIFVVVQVMFEIRQSEIRKGINVKF